ncbi:MAG: hypothetical protein AMXMBFR48_13160 [Ignavibacteriales bacterium]
MNFYKYFYRPFLSLPVFFVGEKYHKMSVLKYLEEIDKMSKWAPSEVTSWQEEKLRALVHKAYFRTRFHNERFRKNKIHPADIYSMKDLEKIPIMRKDEVKKYLDFNYNVDNRVDYYFNATGGSTGIPLQFFVSYEAESIIQAIDLFFKQTFGYQYGAPTLVLGASSLKSKKQKNFFQFLNSRIKGMIPVDVMGINDERMREIIEIISRENIKFIYGYASAIFLVAKFCLEHNISIKIEACFPTSELLTEYYRKTIIEAFNCRILNGYGARDGGVLAYETSPDEFRVGYNSFIEIEVGGKGSRAGAILCTDLFNDVFPFLRYSLGDEIDGLDENKTEYNGQIFRNVIGRSSDLIRLKNGNVLTGPGFTVLFQNINVEAYQIEQISDDHLNCKIVRGKNYTLENENKIRKVFAEKVGKESNVDFTYVESIEQTSAGKTKYFIVR